MRSFRDIKHDYRFMEEDEQRLAQMRPLMEEHSKELMTTQPTRSFPQFWSSALFTGSS